MATGEASSPEAPPEPTGPARLPLTVAGDGAALPEPPAALGEGTDWPSWSEEDADQEGLVVPAGMPDPGCPESPERSGGASGRLFPPPELDVEGLVSSRSFMALLA